MPKLPISLVELLQQALASHKYALALNEENTDILFNTAQVMISLAELAADAGAQADSIPLLRESLEVLSACFSRQEMLREEQSVGFVDEPQGGVPLEAEAPQEPSSSEPNVDSGEREAEEEFVTIQTPITAEDLLDTARASMSALTLLVSLEEATNIPTLAQMAYALTDIKIPQYLKELSEEERVKTEPETALERADFVTSLANAEYKTGSISFEDVLSRLQVLEAFDLNGNVPAMCNYADALVEFASTAQNLGSTSSEKDGPTCWTQLGKAQDLYTRAVKVNNDDSRDRKAQIYESRGDVEMLRLRLASSQGSGLSASIRSSAPTLVKNAQTYYRGASNLFRTEGDSSAAAKVEIRSLIAGVLEGRMSGQVEAHTNALKQRGDSAAAVAVDMMREGLLTCDWDQGL